MLEGDREEAIRHAEQLLRLFPNDGHPYEFLARILAVAALATEQDTKLSAEQRREHVERYAARSVRMLRETARRFPIQPQVWLSDPALVPLRGRDDFRQLIRELEQKAPAPEGAAGL